MKKLLIVMAVVFCASFFIGFTVHTSNDSTTSTNLRPGVMRWKHTTWVNPWVNAKRVLANNLLFEIGTTAGRVASICKLTYSGVTIDLRATCYYCYQWLTLPTGVPITYEFQINWNEFYGQVGWLYDETTGEELFSSYDEYQTFTWTPIAGHQYGLAVYF